MVSFNKKFKNNTQNLIINNQINDTNISDNYGAYLVNTNICRIVLWPMIDEEVQPLYVNMSGKQIECKGPENKYNISIERYNYTEIKVTSDLNKVLNCWTKSVKRVEKSDVSVDYSNEVVFNSSQIQYFPNDIAIQVNCTLSEGLIF